MTLAWGGTLANSPDGPTVQTTLSGPGYCALTGHVFHYSSPGDDCPHCSEQMEEIPEGGHAG